MLKLTPLDPIRAQGLAIRVLRMHGKKTFRAIPVNVLWSRDACAQSVDPTMIIGPVAQAFRANGQPVKCLQDVFDVLALSEENLRNWGGAWLGMTSLTGSSAAKMFASWFHRNPLLRKLERIAGIAA